MKLVHEQQGTLTAASGTAAATLICKNTLLSQIYVKATTATTTFDVKITDIYSRDTYEQIDLTGELNETRVWMPMYGDITLTIDNASADEDFDYILVFEEN